MRFVLHLLVAVSSLLTAPSPASAAPLHDATSDLRQVEHLMYAVTMTQFVTAVNAGSDRLDTSTDWCSAPLVGSTGRSFDFRNACRRHDFGYRNLRLLDRRYSPTKSTYWTAASRSRVDQKFLADMRSHCNARPWYESATCLGWAETFYTAVRTFGGP